MFKQYYGLRKELYILFFGRIVTNMGAMIWPMLTLILSQKVGLDAFAIANIMFWYGILQLPLVYLGGRLADRFSKRNLIVVCDLVTVFSYIVCAMIPTNMTFVLLFCLAGAFASMEGPSYDALVADLTPGEKRQAAYSLGYLGANLGLVLAPIIGGILFERYLWLAFLINAFSTLSSTILIFLFIPRYPKIEQSQSTYEQQSEHHHVFAVLKERKILLFYALIVGCMSFIYMQYNFLMPLHLGELFQAKGALIFGTLTSINALTVILFTPWITSLTQSISEIGRMMMAIALQCIGYIIFAYGIWTIYLGYLSIFIFTIGEILDTISKSPYITRRIPLNYRGRIHSLMMVIVMLVQGAFQQGLGKLIDLTSIDFAWLCIDLFCLVVIVLLYVLRKWDRKIFQQLYPRS